MKTPCKIRTALELALYRIRDAESIAKEENASASIMEYIRRDERVCLEAMEALGKPIWPDSAKATLTRTIGNLTDVQKQNPPGMKTQLEPYIAQLKGVLADLGGEVEKEPVDLNELCENPEVHGFVKIHCDKCGTESYYEPEFAKTVTECFGCKPAGGMPQ